MFSAQSEALHRSEDKANSTARLYRSPSAAALEASDGAGSNGSVHQSTFQPGPSAQAPMVGRSVRTRQQGEVLQRRTTGEDNRGMAAGRREAGAAPCRAAKGG